MGLMDEIKKDAFKTGAKIQTTEESELEQKLNALFYLDKNIKKEAMFVRHVMTRGQETSERKGLHASAIIVSDKVFCYRQQVLSLLYRMEQGENVPIGLKRIFSEGDSIHEKWQRLFIRGGYCDPLQCDCSQFSDEFELSYTPDIICEIDGIEYIVEIKSVNTFTFKKQKSHASGKKQLMLYMYLTGIHNGIVLCEDKNCQDIKAYLYKFDYAEIEEYIARLEKIQYYKHRLMDKHKLVSRHCDCTSYTCKMATSCNMRDACYNKKKERL